MNQPKLSLVLPNIRSCHNVGAMFRTADGTGFEKLYLCGYTATPPKIQIDKVALGAETWIPWEQYDDVGECLAAIKAAGVHIVALEQSDTSIALEEFTPTAPIALVVGNEVDGLSADILALVDTTIHIPMRGRKKSLNVSIAAGITMHHLSQQIYSV
jgi:tRNA G18 (ribose-2'-O)-methylase SpoU